jgi:small subunit ribosomal protein S27Ae
MSQCAGSRLVYQGVILKSLDSLTENANIYVTGDLDGGKKKKKKKAYTTKKKNKHIHKKVKLLALSLYAVDGILCNYLGKGNVTQQRKTCPSCGPGTFMAQHWDRYYCGFCHTTIKMDAETVKKN